MKRSRQQQAEEKDPAVDLFKLLNTAQRMYCIICDYDDINYDFLKY